MRLIVNGICDPLRWSQTSKWKNIITKEPYLLRYVRYHHGIVWASSNSGHAMALWESASHAFACKSTAAAVIIATVARKSAKPGGDRSAEHIPIHFLLQSRLLNTPSGILQSVAKQDYHKYYKKASLGAQCPP